MRRSGLLWKAILALLSIILVVSWFGSNEGLIENPFSSVTLVEERPSKIEINPEAIYWESMKHRKQLILDVEQKKNTEVAQWDAETLEKRDEQICSTYIW